LHIPDHYPGLTSEHALQQYREEFHIPDDVTLAADWHREKLSQGQSRRMQGPSGEQVRAEIGRTLSRPRPDLYGKTGRNPSGKSLSSWPIAKRLTQGRGLVETMDELGAPNHKLIQRRGAAMGLAFDTAFLCDQGEPFRYASLSHLRKAAGFEAEDFDKYVGLSVGRSGAQKADVILNPKGASRAVKWRDDVVTALLAVPPLHVAGKDYRKDEILHTFLPALQELNSALVLTMPEMRKAASEHPEWDVDQLCEEICFAAQREQSAGSTDSRWRKTLRYLWQAEEWILKNLDRLRGPGDDGPLVREMIGSRYGTTQQMVQNALRERTGTIAPMEVRMLILKYAPESAEPPKKDPGRPATMAAIFKEAKKLRNVKNLSYPEIARQLTPEDYKADPRKAGEAIRKGIDRL
jgi:hypothetical protein